MILSDKIEIKINGAKIENYQYSNIKLVQELQKPNELTFCLHKDDLVQDENAIRYSLTEKLLGKSVELLINTVREKDKKIENDTLTFSGTIFNVNILKKNILAGAIIEITAYSPDYFLFDHPHCFSYEKETLQDIVTKTIEPYEIEVNNEPVMEDEIPYTVQYNETNYDFLRRLSSRYGEWFYYEGEKLVFGKLDKKDPVALTLGNDVNDYHYRLNMEHLNFSHAHHDYLAYGNLKTNACDATGNTLHNLTDIAYDSSKELYKKETFRHLRGSAPEESFDEAAISARVQGLGRKAQMLTCYGSSNRAALRIGSLITIEEAFEKEKSGKTQCEHDELVVYKLIHTSDGVSNYENQFAAIPAGSVFPPYTCGDHYPKAATQRAVVMDNKDPEKLGRVRVQFLWQKEQNEELMTPWIRIAQPHGGENKGFYFIPEIEEEVMIGFENGNAEKPYVMGTLYHDRQYPDNNWYTDENEVKALRTKNGHTIEIHDVEKGGFIKIYDHEKENYIITLSTDEQLIRLKSSGNIELKAENDIIIDAKNNIKINAGMDVSIDAGENINEIAGKNVVFSANENMAINAGNNMDRNVGSNDSLYVSSNQTIEIGENKDEYITEKYQLAVENMLVDASEKLKLQSKKHEQKADEFMKFDGGKILDLYAKKMRMN